jgi:hypothetical protein
MEEKEKKWRSKKGATHGIAPNGSTLKPNGNCVNRK